MIFLARPEGVGPGTTLAVKDLFDTEGLVTTYGSAVFAEHVPARTAVAVARLESSGYVNVGKTNLHEFAYGTTSENPHYGTVPNPRAPGRIAGGSSGGTAAALASGEAETGLGTDSGGSIRIPSACCGTVGFKPTHGLVSLEGCFPLAPSFDTGGPMATSVGACIEMMRALVDEFEPRTLESLEEVSVGVGWLDGADELVRARAEEAVASFPRRRALDLPRPPRESYPVFMREVADVHRDLYAEHADLYGENVAVKVERCLEVGDGAYEAALRARAAYREEALAALDGVDLFVSPTLECVAPPTGIGDAALRERLIVNTYPFNALGWPALALPCGPAEDGLAASIQLVGRPGADALVLAAGELLEAAMS